MYTKNEEIKNEFEKIYYKETLDNTGVEVIVTNDPIKYNIQNAILKATEKRLLEEINHVKELKKENEELRIQLESLI